MTKLAAAMTQTKWRGDYIVVASKFFALRMHFRCCGEDAAVLGSRFTRHFASPGRNRCSAICFPSCAPLPDWSDLPAWRGRSLRDPDIARVTEIP